MSQITTTTACGRDCWARFVAFSQEGPGFDSHYLSFLTELPAQSEKELTEEKNTPS